jgi:hypothetical protein
VFSDSSFCSNGSVSAYDSGAMSVAQGTSIFVPYVCAIYTCRCGRRAVRHGSESGSPPRDWESWPAGEHICDVCCAKASRSTT